MYVYFRDERLDGELNSAACSLMKIFIWHWKEMLKCQPLAKQLRRAAFLPDLRLLRWDRPTLLSIMCCD